MEELRDVLVEFAKAEYNMYGTYSHYAGVLESLLVKHVGSSTELVNDLKWILEICLTKD